VGCLSEIKKHCIAVEGYDAVGKTTLSRRIAELRCGLYIRTYGEVGAKVRRLHEAGHLLEANQIALNAAADHVRRAPPDIPLIFDRHWMTIIAFTSTRYLDLWLPRPQTVLCVCDPEIIEARLKARGEDCVLEKVAHYSQRFDQIAKTLSVPLIDTGRLDTENALDRALWLFDRKRHESIN
jgi:thymidylate kinase